MRTEGIYRGTEALIGNTPLVEMVHMEEKKKLSCRLLGKLEFFNPSGSVKDRIAKNMIEQAEKDGVLAPGATIIEPTSGNTGIGLAALSAAKGYHLILVMPESMSVERRALLKAYGAELVLTDARDGMGGAISMAERLHKEFPGSFLPGQFTNPANPDIHRRTTGPEIWKDTCGKVDVLVAGVGTGGTITGAGEYLKSQNPHIEIVAVEPKDSPMLSVGCAGPHKIQGIGAGFMPKNLNQKVYDKVIAVENEDAFCAAKEMAKAEGILAGISSGAAMHAALSLAGQKEYEGKTIVVILPDGGDRYYSTPLFS